MKFYLYADETIWTSPAGFLIVAVVALPGDQVEYIRSLVTRLEVASGRDKRKWAQSLTAKKIAFLDGLGPILDGSPPILWRHHPGTNVDQVRLTALVVAGAAHQVDPLGAFYVMIDGFKKAEGHLVSGAMKSRGLAFKKIVGGRDESEPLLRLADALAGFLGDRAKGKPYTIEAWRRVGHLFQEV